MCDANHIIIAANIFNNILSCLSVINSHYLLFSYSIPCHNHNIFYHCLIFIESSSKYRITFNRPQCLHFTSLVEYPYPFSSKMASVCLYANLFLQEVHNLLNAVATIRVLLSPYFAPVGPRIISRA